MGLVSRLVGWFFGDYLQTTLECDHRRTTDEQQVDLGRQLVTEKGVKITVQEITVCDDCNFILEYGDERYRYIELRE